MSPMSGLLSIEEALRRVLARARVLEAESVSVAAAAGRYLAEDVGAAVDLPPFASSAMDGYALRAADTPGRLPIVFRIAAGVPADRALKAVEIAIDSPTFKARSAGTPAAIRKTIGSRPGVSAARRA